MRRDAHDVPAARVDPSRIPRFHHNRLMTQSISRRGLILSSAAAGAAAALPEALFAESPSRPSSVPGLSLVSPPRPEARAHVDDRARVLRRKEERPPHGHGRGRDGLRRGRREQALEPELGDVRGRVREGREGRRRALAVGPPHVAREGRGRRRRTTTRSSRRSTSRSGTGRASALGRPVHQLLGMPGARHARHDVLDRDRHGRSHEAEDDRRPPRIPKLKIKIGLANDEENIAAIRSVSSQADHGGRERGLGDGRGGEEEDPLAERRQAALPRAADAGGDGRRDGEAQGPRDVSRSRGRGRPHGAGRREEGGPLRRRRREARESRRHHALLGADRRRARRRSQDDVRLHDRVVRRDRGRPRARAALRLARPRRQPPSRQGSRSRA